MGKPLHQGEIYSFKGSCMTLAPSQEIKGVFTPVAVFSFAYRTQHGELLLSIPSQYAIVIDLHTFNFDLFFEQFIKEHPFSICPYFCSQHPIETTALHSPLKQSINRNRLFHIQ